MIRKEHLKNGIFELALQNLTTKDDTENPSKDGLLKSIRDVINSAGKKVKHVFIREEAPEKEEQVLEFFRMFDCFTDQWFTAGAYNQVQKRNQVTRKPAYLPKQTFIKSLRDFILKVSQK